MTNRLTKQERRDVLQMADAIERGWAIVGHRQARYRLFDIEGSGRVSLKIADRAIRDGKQVRACAIGCALLGGVSDRVERKVGALFHFWYGLTIWEANDQKRMRVPTIVKRLRALAEVKR